MVRLSFVIALVGSYCASTTLAQSAAASCSAATQQYNTLQNFSGPNACFPTGYSSAQDLGNTNPTDLQARCAAQCNSLGSRCSAWVGQLFKAADSNLYTGQCFYYQTAPSVPRQCADYPTIIVASQKDDSLACLANAPAGSQFCSSYLGAVTRTVYTSTVTPKTTTTVTAYTTTTKTSTATSTSTSVTRITSLVVASSTATTTETKTPVSTALSIAPAPSISVVKRQASRVATPACLTTTSVPASRISSACQCFSIGSTTISTVSTASVSTVRTTITLARSNTATQTSTIFTVQTSFTTSFTTTVSLTTTTVTVSDTVTVPSLASTFYLQAIETPSLYLALSGSGLDVFMEARPVSSAAPCTIQADGTVRCGPDPANRYTLTQSEGSSALSGYTDARLAEITPLNHIRAVPCNIEYPSGRFTCVGPYNPDFKAFGYQNVPGRVPYISLDIPGGFSTTYSEFTFRAVLIPAL